MITSIMYLYMFFNIFTNRKIIKNDHNFYHKFNINFENKYNNVVIKWENIYNKFNIQLENKKKYNNVIEQLNLKFLYNKIIKQVNSNVNYFYWKKDNVLIEHLNKFKLIIINLETFYSYNEKKLYNSYYLNNIIKYCKLNNILFNLIGEYHPEQINNNFSNILNNLTLFDYISPFHYNNKAIRLKNNKLSNKSSNININKIIKDIIFRNNLTKKDTCYIGNDLTNYQTYKLCFN